MEICVNMIGIAVCNLVLHTKSQKWMFTCEKNFANTLVSKQFFESCKLTSDSSCVGYVLQYMIQMKYTSEYYYVTLLFFVSGSIDTLCLISEISKKILLMAFFSCECWKVFQKWQIGPSVLLLSGKFQTKGPNCWI